MQLKQFLLDEWLAQKFSADPRIEFDLGSSTGPVWTLRELLAIEGGDVSERLLETALSYTSPEGTAELREQIAAMHGVDPEEVQIVTGAAEALLLHFYQAAEHDANVVLPEPGFPSNTVLPESLGIEVRRYRLDADNRFAIDPDEIRRQVDRNTRFVLVNSPHNPTGTVISESEMENLHDFCADRGVGFVSDEVYHPIYHGPELRSAARLPHATVLGDFSKALCLSGLRTGWIIERDPARRAWFKNARSYFTVSNTALGERLAALAVRHRETIYRRARRIASANLSLLDRVFAEHTGILRWVRPAGGMTAFPWLADGSDGREFCRAMARHGILLAPGDCFGVPSHFRLGFAASGEKFAAAMERVEALLGRTAAAG
ncbi:MAG TPA: pyridoxal phosphate-dependent aminotransferase [Verrucomicrobiae bacterium]|nr:pyridoxal phosphate-dependent aminotransferase [Verrucomicrobiae bacterium]